jgi:hypothetical protein
MLRNSWVAAQLAASQEGLSFMELVGEWFGLTFQDLHHLRQSPWYPFDSNVVVGPVLGEPMILVSHMREISSLSAVHFLCWPRLTSSYTTPSDPWSEPLPYNILSRKPW